MIKDKHESIIIAVAGGDEDLRQVARLAVWKNKGASYCYQIKAALWAVQNEKKRSRATAPLTRDIPVEENKSDIYFNSLIDLVKTETGKSLVESVYRDGVSISEWARNNQSSQPTASRLHRQSLKEIKEKSQLEF